jgi:hypothetical protein
MAAPGPQRQVAPSFFSNTWQIAGCALDNMAGYDHIRDDRVSIGLGPRSFGRLAPAPAWSMKSRHHGPCIEMSHETAIDRVRSFIRWNRRLIDKG